MIFLQTASSTYWNIGMYWNILNDGVILMLAAYLYACIIIPGLSRRVLSIKLPFEETPRSQFQWNRSAVGSIGKLFALHPTGSYIIMPQDRWLRLQAGPWMFCLFFCCLVGEVSDGRLGILCVKGSLLRCLTALIVLCGGIDVIELFIPLGLRGSLWRF